MNNLKSNANGMLNMLKGGNSAVSLLFICAVLQACGGESNNPSSSENPVTPPVTTSVALYTSDTYSTSYEDTPSEVVLDPYVKASDGSQPVLVDVRSLSSGVICEDIDVGSDRFSVEVGQPGVCVYEYTVANQTERTLSAARSRVLESGTSVVTVSAKTASSSASAPLPVISETAELGEVIDIHLVNPGEMTLSNDVTLLGYGQVVSVDTVEEVITFQAGTSEADSGVSRIYYHYSDADGYVRSGWIDIAVSESTSNTAPLASNFYYLEDSDAEQGKSFTVIGEGELVNIDVSEYVVDSDGDELQLVNVQTFNAETELVSPQDLSNKRFTFKSNSPGQYQVSYTVSDHLGGFASGIVEVRVNGAWQNVIVESTKDVFSAPSSLLAASVADYDFSGVASEALPPEGNGVANVPVYDWDTANAVCVSRGGSLPTSEQWQAFIDQEGNPYIDGDSPVDTVDEWPIAVQYWTRTESGDSNFETVDLSDGSFHAQGHGLNGGEAYLGYVACIDQTPTSLKIVNSPVIAMRQTNYLKAEYMTASGLNFPYTKPLLWSYSEPSDTSFEPIPDIHANVDLGPYSGELVTYESGFVSVEVQDITGELSTSKVFESVENLLITGEQLPSFEFMGISSGECSELTLHTYVPTVGQPTQSDSIYPLEEIGIEFSQYAQRVTSSPTNPDLSNPPTGTTVKLISNCSAPEGNSFLRVHGRQLDTYTSGGESYTPSLYFELSKEFDLSTVEEVELSYNFRLVSDRDPTTDSPNGRWEGVRISTGFLNEYQYDLGRSKPTTILQYGSSSYELFEPYNPDDPSSSVEVSAMDSQGWFDVKIVYPASALSDRFVVHMDFDRALGEMYYDFDDFKILPR